MNLLDLEGYWPLLIKGAKLTMVVGAGAMIIAMLLGLTTALCKLSHLKSISFIAGMYTTIIRGIPELVLILLVYYGAPTLVQDTFLLMGKEIFIDINPLIAGTLTIGFIYGAFATEVFRGAFLAVPRGQVEAAMACGMNGLLIFRRVLLPQMWRFALPGLSNVWMVLIKATALISVIQLPELMRNADIAAKNLKKPFTCYFAASLLYLLITVLSLIFQQWAEKRADKGVRRAV